jgi:hypothetical protein
MLIFQDSSPIFYILFSSRFSLHENADVETLFLPMYDGLLGI